MGTQKSSALQNCVKFWATLSKPRCRYLPWAWAFTSTVKSTRVNGDKFFLKLLLNKFYEKTTPCRTHSLYVDPPFPTINRPMWPSSPISEANTSCSFSKPTQPHPTSGSLFYFLFTLNTINVYILNHRLWKINGHYHHYHSFNFIHLTGHWWPTWHMLHAMVDPSLCFSIHVLGYERPFRWRELVRVPTWRMGPPLDVFDIVKQDRFSIRMKNDVDLI